MSRTRNPFRERPRFGDRPTRTPTAAPVPAPPLMLRGWPMIGRWHVIERDTAKGGQTDGGDVVLCTDGRQYATGRVPTADAAPREWFNGAYFSPADYPTPAGALFAAVRSFRERTGRASTIR